jgi:hypothetical protein
VSLSAWYASARRNLFAFRGYPFGLGHMYLNLDGRTEFADNRQMARMTSEWIEDRGAAARLKARLKRSI